MMRKATLLLTGALFLLSGIAHADEPIFRWVKSLDGSHTPALANPSMATGIATDREMNVYITGWFYNSLDLDPGQGTAAIVGDNDTLSSYVAKYDSTGTYMWGRTIRGAQSMALAVDRNGSVIIGGNFLGYVDFNPTPGGVAAYVSKPGSKDFFVTKFDNNGQFQWARASGGSGEDVVNAIAVDSSGYVYITGSMASNTNVDFNERNPLTVLYTTTMKDGFVARYDELGNYGWSVQLAGTQDDIGQSIRVNDIGDLFVGGTTGGCKFRQDATLIPGNGGMDLFVARYSAYDGALAWAKVHGGTGDEAAYGLGIDDSGYVYAGGAYTSASFSFDPNNAAATLTKLNSGTDEDGYLLRLTPDGVFSWTRNLSGNGREFLYSVDVDDSGFVYCAGTFTTTIGLDVPHTSAGGRDLYTFKMNRDNQFVWTEIYGSPEEEERPTIACGLDYSHYLAGGIGSTTRFGTDIDPITNIDRGLAFINNPNATQVSNTFFAKYRHSGGGGTIPDAIHDRNVLNAVTLYPNPARSFVVVANAPLASTSAVYSLSGQCLVRQTNYGTKQEVGVGSLAPGYYMLQVETKDGVRRGFSFLKQ